MQRGEMERQTQLVKKASRQTDKQIACYQFRRSSRKHIKLSTKLLLGSTLRITDSKMEMRLNDEKIFGRLEDVNESFFRTSRDGKNDFH